MIDLRKILIIFIIAVLFSVFVHALIIAIDPSPRYDDFCGGERFARPFLDKSKDECTDITGPTEQEQSDCRKTKGFIEYSYDEFNCPSSWSCQTCQFSYNEARKQHNYLVFIVSSILGLIAIALALYLPLKKNHLNQWISTGFMLGGLITLFIGTIRFFSELGRFVRPVVILAELIIVIYIAYKKIKK